jgi:hypothetical protein
VSLSYGGVLTILIARPDSDQTVPFYFPFISSKAQKPTRAFSYFRTCLRSLPESPHRDSLGPSALQPQPGLQPPLRSCEDFGSVALPRRVPCPLAMRNTPTSPRAMVEGPTARHSASFSERGTVLSLALCGKGSIDPDSAATILCSAETALL